MRTYQPNNPAACTDDHGFMALVKACDTAMMTSILVREDLQRLRPWTDANQYMKCQTKEMVLYRNCIGNRNFPRRVS